MILSFCLCFLSGFLLGMRYRVYVLVPASAAAMLLAGSVALASNVPWLADLGLLVVCPAVLQAGYAAALLIQLRLASGGVPDLRTF